MGFSSHIKYTQRYTFFSNEPTSNSNDLFPLAPMREAANSPFLCKERASAMPLRQIFVQGASFSEILPAIFCISGEHQRRPPANFCARSEFQRDSSGNIFVRGASFSDAPSGSFCPAGPSTLPNAQNSQKSPNSHITNGFPQRGQLSICKQTLKTCFRTYFLGIKFGGEEKRL